MSKVKITLAEAVKKIKAGKVSRDNKSFEKTLQALIQDEIESRETQIKKFKNKAEEVREDKYDSFITNLACIDDYDISSYDERSASAKEYISDKIAELNSIDIAYAIIDDEEYLLEDAIERYESEITSLNTLLEELVSLASKIKVEE